MMHKLIKIACLLCLGACGSSSGTGATGGASVGFSAPFISNAVQSSSGAWGTLQGSASDGNTIINYREVFVLFSNVDVCSMLTTNPNSTAEPEALSISFISKTFGLPVNGNYVIGEDSNDLSAGAAGLATLTFSPANVTAGDKVYSAVTGSVRLTTTPSSATAGTVAGSVSAAFEGTTVQGDTSGTGGQTLDSTDDPNGNTAATAAGSATGSFSANYCAALTAVLTEIASEDSITSTDGNVQMLPRAQSHQQRLLARIPTGFSKNCILSHPKSRLASGGDTVPLDR